VRDQESIPRPHTPRPAALPVEVEQWVRVFSAPICALSLEEGNSMWQRLMGSGPVLAGVALPYITKPGLGPVVTGGADFEAENANLSLLPISRSGTPSSHGCKVSHTPIMTSIFGRLCGSRVYNFITFMVLSCSGPLGSVTTK